MALPSALPSIRGAATLPDQLVAALSRAIIDGTFKPGDRLQPDEIAAHFAVSRIPVREALRALEASGWVEVRPHRGVFVQEHSEAELVGLFETRFILEPQLARLAAARRSAEELATLRSVLAEGRAALKAGDKARFADTNQAFHATCAAAAGNAYAARVVDDIEARLQWYFTAVPLPRSRTTFAEHERIFRAIEAGDAAAAEAATVDHLNNTRRTALARLQG